MRKEDTIEKKYKNLIKMDHSDKKKLFLTH